MSDQPVPGVPAVVTEERCLNCDAPLTGEYCANCGQHKAHHVHSTPALVSELIEDLFHADHRVWRTLSPLLFKPGWLTNEYLRGKRVTYTPPFRLYIVLSLIFFFTNSLTHDAVKIETDATVSTQASAGGAEKTYEIDEDVRENLDEFLGELEPADRDSTRTHFEAALRKAPPAEQAELLAGMSNFSRCSPEVLERALPDSPKSRKKLLDTCRKATRNSGKDVVEAVSERAPQVLFFFLPLIALFAKVLYLGSHRYYAEHFLFFVHFHACVFLLMTFNNVLGWMIGWIPQTGFITGLLTATVFIYSPIYLYRAMRNVYGQGKLVTRLKFLFLLGGYIGNMFLAFAIVAAYSAMTLD